MAKRPRSEASNEAEEGNSGSEAEEVNSVAALASSEEDSSSTEEIDRWDWKYITEPTSEPRWKEFQRCEVEKLWYNEHLKVICLPYRYIAQEPHKLTGPPPKRVRFTVMENHVVIGYPDSLLYSKKYKIYLTIRKSRP